MKKLLVILKKTIGPKKSSRSLFLMINKIKGQVNELSSLHTHGLFAQNLELEKTSILNYPKQRNNQDSNDNRNSQY